MATPSFISAVAKRLQGKVALITGGSSGIGGCTARVFAHHGAKVVIADVQDALGETMSQSIGGPENCTYIHCDVTDEAQIANVVDKTVSTYGKLDIMFGNAGIINPNQARIADNEKSDFERVLTVNVTGVFLGMKHAARVMIPAKSGSIISTASISSAVGGAGSHAYCASKHAVLGLTRNVAAELGQFGIRVNCLSPFGVATPLLSGFRRRGGGGGGGDGDIEDAMSLIANLKGLKLKAEDVANAALYLASDEARYISGQNLLVDGGFCVSNPSFHLFEYPPAI